MTNPTSNKILVPVDFEQASIAALEFAKTLALKLSAEVVVVHAYAVPVFAYPGASPILMPAMNDQIEQAAQKSLTELALKHKIEHFWLREGDPADVILKEIENIQPLMVVMGTHGRRGITRLLLGSVAEKIVRMSPAPVLTVRSE